MVLRDPVSLVNITLNESHNRCSKGVAVSLQAQLIYLPQVENGDCQQQEQRNDSQKDDPPSNFGNIFKLTLQENGHPYLRMVCSQDRGEHV